MRTRKCSLIMMMLAICVTFFAAAASARDFTFNVPANGNPYETSEGQRQTSFVNFLGGNDLLGGLSNGDTVVVNWTGGSQVWRSNWSVTTYGSGFVFTETSTPELAFLRYAFADQQRYCQNSYTLATLDGYWQDWEVQIGGVVVNSGSEFVATDYHSTGTSLCYHNL